MSVATVYCFKLRITAQFRELWLWWWRWRGYYDWRKNDNNNIIIIIVDFVKIKYFPSYDVKGSAGVWSKVGEYIWPHERIVREMHFNGHALPFACSTGLRQNIPARVKICARVYAAFVFFPGEMPR
jgi:hypothetical protein